MKNVPGDISIILDQCTKNHYHNMCRSSDKERTSFFSILGNFFPFTPLAGQNSKFSKKNKKKQLDIL